METKNNYYINRYLFIINLSHAVFALPFALIGFFIAIRTVDTGLNWRIFILIILCLIFARNTARNFNRYFNRGITKNPINLKKVLVKIIVYTVLFILCTYFINPLIFKLSPVALLIICSYGFTKKTSFLSHFILGLNLSLTPIGAYVAVTEVIDTIPILFALIILFWVSACDIIYAALNQDYIISRKIVSIPTIIGKSKAIILSGILHFITSFLIIYAGNYAGFGRWYGLGAFIFIGILIYEYLLINNVKHRIISLKFVGLNSLAGILFATFTILDLYLN